MAATAAGKAQGRGGAVVYENSESSAYSSLDPEAQKASGQSSAAAFSRTQSNVRGGHMAHQSDNDSPALAALQRRQ